MTEAEIRRQLRELKTDLSSYKNEKQKYTNGQTYLNDVIQYLKTAKGRIPNLESQLNLSFVIKQQIACKDSIENIEDYLQNTIKSLNSINSPISTQIRTLIRLIERTESRIFTLESKLPLL